MNDGRPVHRILLVTSHDCHERDLLEALRDGAEQKSDFVVELVSFDLEHSTNFFVVFSLLDRLRSDYFSAVHLVWRAATWSRVRHSSVPGKPPLGTRQETLGACRLAPPQQHKVAQSNSEMEASCWFLEQVLRCKYRCSWSSLKTLVGRRLRGSFEVRSLTGPSDAQRGSALTCELTGADQRRPLAIFTNISSFKARMRPGWPSLHLQGNTELRDRGPLPLF